MVAPFRVSLAAHKLQHGAVIAYPTEAVWGLGCDPHNARALLRLLRLKHRAAEKGLILVAAHIDQLMPLLRDLTSAQRETLAATWPGPVTWLIPHRQLFSPLVTGKHSTIAVRVSAHPGVAALCRAFGGPLVSTSANPQGLAPATTRLGARCYFGSQLDDYLPGQVGGRAAPSEIRDLCSGAIIRPGGG